MEPLQSTFLRQLRTVWEKLPKTYLLLSLMDCKTLTFAAPMQTFCSLELLCLNVFMIGSKLKPDNGLKYCKCLCLLSSQYTNMDILQRYHFFLKKKGEKKPFTPPHKTNHTLYNVVLSSHFHFQAFPRGQPLIKYCIHTIQSL